MNDMMLCWKVILHGEVGQLGKAPQVECDPPMARWTGIEEEERSCWKVTPHDEVDQLGKAPQVERDPHMVRWANMK